MSFFDELLELLELAPDSATARFVSVGVIGLAVAAVVGWVVYTSPDPWNEPAWSFSAIVGSFVWGSAAVLFSGLYLAREGLQGPAAFCLFANVAAIAVPFLTVMP